MKSEPKSPMSHESMVRRSELLIAGVLRTGVLLSAGVILLGIIVFFAGQPGITTNVNTLTFPHTPGAVFSAVLHGDARGIIMLGLLLLIATPVSRIAVSIVTFAIERDWRYVAITTTVLLILIISFTLGKAGG